VVLELLKHAQEAFRIQAQSVSGVRHCVAQACRSGLAKKFPGPVGVPLDALWLAFPDLHACGGQMNEPLGEPGLGSRPAEGVPEALPGFVCFPVKAAVEELQSEEPAGILGEQCGKGEAPGGRFRRKTGEGFRRDGDSVRPAVEMPVGISDGMGMLVARNVAVRRE
jgi:hypothetical protein